MPRTGRWIAIAVGVAVAVPMLVIVGGTVVKSLWNWLLPPLFGWPQVTWWQAIGLLALCRILVGGCGFGRGTRYGPDGGKGMRDRMAERMADRMADRVAERWDHMSPEERERFRQRIRERCGFDPTGGES